ncbi:MAG: carotenoid 1,2-hydratase [Burkholderiales bacterium]|nr:carotenoid 1,2-hydratase [Burkholderiales bacterium]
MAGAEQLDTLFDTRRPVPDGGYRWWYLDALSDDGSRGITVIVFIGSVFSPYYAWRLARGPVAALDHCAVNVALYQPGMNRWTMTERSASAVRAAPDRLAIGPSTMQWTRDASGKGVLTLEIDEVCAPVPRRVRGRIRVTADTVHTREYSLDVAGRHHWRPIAPQARVDVELDAPQLSWHGAGYLDSNRGDEPITEAFRHWHWSRCRLADGRAAIVYDIERREGGRLKLGLDFDAGRAPRDFFPPLSQPLPHGLWGVRSAIACAEGAPQLAHRLEDGPFYLRSVVETRLLGEPVIAMHESLDLDRLCRNWVRVLLPFRMPRRG